MITSKAELNHYLEADRINLRRSEHRPRITDEVWKFQRLLRHLEYIIGTRAHPLIRKYWTWRLHRQSLRCGFEIPPGVFGPGLSIAHRGTIVVHPKARVGANCRIHVDVVIGTQPGPPPEKVPIIDDNCYIGPGVKIYGNVRLGKNLVIGANSVVNQSFPEGECTIAGAPARQVSGRNSAEYIIATRTPS
jgi:serine O-acetyltransferase